MSKLSNELTMIKLLQNRKYSIQELSELLEVTPRMIRIYKSDIEMSGFIVNTYMGPNGGYKIDNTINDFLIIKDEYKNIYKDISTCITEYKKIKLTYVTKDIETIRIIHPHKIYNYKDNYIISAFCELRGDIRDFEFKRIINYEILNEFYK